MPAFRSYCEYCATLPADHHDRIYHDTEYGYPISDDAGLFGRLVLEINQAGLSWSTILRKKDAFYAAYGGFDVDAVAAYGEADVARLMGDAGIIRNRRKIAAAIENARRIVALRAAHGSFKAWLDAHHPRDKASWLALFKAEFVFVGGEIVGEFLMSSGYLPGAHEPGCASGRRAVKAGAAWAARSGAARAKRPGGPSVHGGGA